MTSSPPDAQLTHIGFYVADIDKMVSFYQKILGMVVTDSGEGGGRAWAFLSRNPREHHQIVLATGRTPELGQLINQISFRVESLNALRDYYAFVSDNACENLESVTHGNAWSVYFLDPEGNRIELYAVSPWYVTQPMRVPVDLLADEQDILEQTEALVKNNPSLCTQEEWSLNLANRISPS